MATEAVKLPEEIVERITEASKLLGIKKQELVDRALLVYLDNLSKYLDLKKELQAWDTLSDEALTNFEQSL